MGEHKDIPELIPPCLYEFIYRGSEVCKLRGIVVPTGSYLKLAISREHHANGAEAQRRDTT